MDFNSSELLKRRRKKTYQNYYYLPLSAVFVHRSNKYQMKNDFIFSVHSLLAALRIVVMEKWQISWPDYKVITKEIFFNSTNLIILRRRRDFDEFCRWTTIPWLFHHKNVVNYALQLLFFWFGLSGDNFRNYIAIIRIDIFLITLIYIRNGNNLCILQLTYNAPYFTSFWSW